jgi:ubiquinone/menaquinone biosynthesis C-methylase UbiE
MEYVGTELDLFAHAKNWKRYWSSHVGRYISGDVLEVGAGIGANTPLLQPSRAKSWTCLEPDPNLANRLRAAVEASAGGPAMCSVVTGTTGDLDPNSRFDCLLYIDVLEHIERDQEELERAAGLLHSGGCIVVLSPAHNWLYTPFDKSIGHFRRYNRSRLRKCKPSNCAVERLFYLDSCGLLASAANRLLLNQSMPTLDQILFWDRYLVRSSTTLDMILRCSIGKSIVGIFRKI